MSHIRNYKCPHCEYYMWEGKEFYECKLEQENAELRSTLQDIKEIIEKGQWDFAGVTEKQILQKISEVE